MNFTARRFRPALVLGLAMLFFASCSEKEESTVDPQVLATVGDREIRIADLEQEWTRRTSRGRPVESAAALLEEMVTEEAMVQRARLSGLDQNPEIQRSIRALLIGTLKESELTSKLKALQVTDQELQDAYQADLDSFRQGEQIRLAVIQINRSPRASETKMAEVKARLAQCRELALASPDGFTKAAAKFSDHQASRFRGGDVGWIASDQGTSRLAPEAVAAGQVLPEDGAVSETVETATGYYLVKRLETKPGTTIPLERVAPRLRAELLKQKRLDAAQAFEDETRSEVAVTRFEDRLKNVKLKAPAEDGPRPPAGPSSAN